MTRVFALAPGAIFLWVSIAAGAAEPLSPATIADVRCVVVASVSASEPANAKGAALLTFYFLGRLDSREPPSFDLSQAMLAQINLMSPADFNAEGKRCGKELEARAEYMIEVSKALTEQKK
jgi:hypothetical protein